MKYSKVCCVAGLLALAHSVPQRFRQRGLARKGRQEVAGGGKYFANILENILRLEIFQATSLPQRLRATSPPLLLRLRLSTQV